MSKVELVPAALATGPAGNVSQKYQFISTLEVVKGLEDLGMQVASSFQAHTKKPEYDGVQQHRVIMEFPDNPKMDVGDYKFNLNLVNSHCRTSTFGMFLGIMVMVCSNGLIVKQSEQTVCSLMHRKADYAKLVKEGIDFKAIMKQNVDEAIGTIRVIKRMQKKEMTVQQQNRLAKFALGLRWSSEQKFPHALLLETRREEQEKPTVWNIMNRVQENMIRGGFEYQSKDKNDKAITRHMPQIRSIKRDIGLNADLWEHACKFVEV